MKKRTKWKRVLAAVLSLTLLTGVLGACGEEETAGEGSVSQTPGESASGTGGGPDSARGRYVEKEEILPQELTDGTIHQLFTVEGRLHLLTSMEQEEKTILREWEKQQDGFVDVTQEWLASMELSCGGWLEAQISQGQDGIQYLYTGYVQEGTDSFMGRLWKGGGDTAQEITPKEWSTPNEEWGGYEMIQGFAALDNGTLVSISYSTLYLHSGEDGRVLESDTDVSVYEGGIVTDGKNVYLRSSDGTGGQIEKRPEGHAQDGAVIPLPTGGAGDNVFVFGGGSGSMKLTALKDGTLVAAGEDGIFRLAGGDPQGQWEMLVEGLDTDFAVTDRSCTGLAALEDGSIYGLFQVDGKVKLNRYEYDPDAVSQVTQVLKLYTVYENSLLKQAATLYHKANPQVRIDIEYEYAMYSYDVPDFDAIYKKLNTLLLGEDAPDILVLDDLNMETYVSKGLLEDLDELIRTLEESGEVMSNITGAYVREDGKRYGVPLQYSFNMALGRDITPEQMGTVESLAAFLSQQSESYLGNQTPGELVDKFYPYFCEEMVRDKQLDREVMGRYLEYLKAIGDNCGIVSTRPENELCYSMWDLGGKAKLAFSRAGGFTNCMSSMSMVDYIKGDFTAFENRFSPSLLMGVRAQSQYLDTAKDFLRFALSSQVQDTESNGSFPVNHDSLRRQAEKDRSDFSMTTMIEQDDGGYEVFDAKAFPKETADRLVAMCEGLDKPVKEDAKIREVLTECLGPYLAGTQSKEETLQKIEDGLKMYLAE